MKKFILNLSYRYYLNFCCVTAAFQTHFVFIRLLSAKAGVESLNRKKSLNYIELIKSAIILFLYTRKWKKKECKVGAAIELSAAMWQTEYNGVVAFFRLDLVTTFSGFQFFLFFFGYFTPRFSLWEQSTLPQSRFVTFLFCLPKKIKRINFHLKQKIHNPRPRSSSLNIQSLKFRPCLLMSHVTFFTITQSKLTPSYFLNWLKLKSMYLHL